MSTKVSDFGDQGELEAKSPVESKGRDAPPGRPGSIKMRFSVADIRETSLPHAIDCVWLREDRILPRRGRKGRDGMGDPLGQRLKIHSYGIPSARRSGEDRS